MAPGYNQWKCQLNMTKPLEKYVKHGTVFGPTDAGMIKVHDIDILRKFFDPQNKICNAIKLNPSIVIGRRGSGKTAYLHSVFLDSEYQVVLEIRTSKTFSQIVSQIESNTPRYALVEEIEALWEDLFFLALIAELAKKYSRKSQELSRLKDFIAKVDPDTSIPIDSFLWKVVKSLSSRNSGNLIGSVSSIVEQVTGVDFEYAKTIALNLLELEGIRAIILLDSLEQYPVEIPSVAHALSGLLKCAGQFNERYDRFSLRLCLPAELYHTFFDYVSTNPHKDLTPPNALTLHWVAGELLSISAHRLALFLDMYFPKLGTEYYYTPSMNRSDARDFLLSFLPMTAINALGQREDTLAYILRHTQLQPRHLLLYLNAIFERERTHGSKYPRISSESVVKAISANEYLLAEEVFSGYLKQHPNTRVLCEACIPELPLIFREPDLHQVFIRKGKKATGERDFVEFRRILIETGIVGRVVDSTDRYMVGRFEYTEPHKLVVGSKDELCLHPVFASAFNCRLLPGKLHKPIYPYGSDPEAEDYRSWQFSGDS
jgi:hypothetical protein